jgi:alkanesulfonate monooxygenase SsuD/methylene tetrahydromethanopterin reductase-like flavin-dependent oxidoreductase (luciferase family)
MTPILGRTVEEAHAKRDRFRQYIDWEGGLAKLSSFVNFAFRKLPPDVPFVFDDKGTDNSVHTMLKTIKRYYDGDSTLTPRMLGETMAFCGFGPLPVGTPEMIADLMEKWRDEADIDGFNISCKSSKPPLAVELGSPSTGSE